VARDSFIRLDRCQYCGRPGFIVWDDDLFTCGREVCESLAFAEVRRRHHDGRYRAPEERLARALLASFDTFDHALQLDVEGDVLPTKEAAAIRERERAETARLLSELHGLSRRYPPPPPEPVLEPTRTQTLGPRYRRVVSRGHTVPLQASS
jgi:hypothetical protein